MQSDRKTKDRSRREKTRFTLYAPPAQHAVDLTGLRNFTEFEFKGKILTECRPDKDENDSSSNMTDLLTKLPPYDNTKIICSDNRLVTKESELALISIIKTAPLQTFSRRCSAGG